MLIHVGFHKTGTSWLQKELFNLGCGFEPVLTHYEVMQLIDKKRLYNFDAEGTAKYVKDKISDITNYPVISSEILSGSPLNSGLTSLENVYKLKKSFPNSKVLIFIRNQPDFLGSIYNQYVKTGGILNENLFLTLHETSPSHYFWSDEHIKYTGIIKEYIAEFGIENVMVYQYENFDDKKKFYKELETFLGFDFSKPIANETVNRSLNSLTLPILRWVNHFYRTPNNPSPMINLVYGRDLFVKCLKFISDYIPKSQPKFQRCKIIEKFFEDNKELERIVGELDSKYFK